MKLGHGAWLAVVVLAGCGGLDRSSDVRVAPAGFAPEAPEPTEGTEIPDTTPDTEPDPTETGEGTTDTGTTGSAGAIEACYPGSSFAYTDCLPLVQLSPVPVEYDYPAPLDGSGQYAEPLYYLDLAVEDPNLYVAPNFQLSELAQEYKGQYAVVQVHAVERLQDMRDELGALVVNSGYRSPDYNASVGGATWSRHMYGDAFDLDPVSVDLDTLADTCYAHGAGYVGYYATHIHCDWRDDPLDASFYGGARSAILETIQPELTAELVRVGAELHAPAEGWDEGEPLREWTAYDAAGAVLATAVAQTWEPPADAAWVEVVVGREVVVEIAL